MGIRPFQIERPLLAASSINHLEKEIGYRCCKITQAYPASVVLFNQDEEAHAVYCIEHGMVKLARNEASGNSVILGFRCAGWFLGGPAVILERPYSTTAETLTRCNLRVIPANEFREMMQTDPRFSLHLNNVFCSEIYQQNIKISEIAYMPARHRLERILWKLVQSQESWKDGRKNKITLRLDIKQWEIAQLIAVTPEYLSRMIKELEEEGIISRRRGFLEIPNPHLLRRRP